MVVRGRWKYVAFGRAFEAFADYAPLLYDLDRDPKERVDLAGNRTDVVAALDAVLRADLATGSNALSAAGDYQAIDAYAKRQNQALYRTFFLDALEDRLADHAACAAAGAVDFDADADAPCRFAAAPAATLRDLFDAAYRGFDDADWDKVQAWIAEVP